jgi:peptidoglycan/LPS O-acetylase OafA/YrhL
MPSEVTPDQPAEVPASRRLDIQGLRAVAVILVVVFHAGLPVPGGFIGVDVFLVISGFVITGMLMRELKRSGTIRFRTFYTRRIKRLLPALALLTTVVMAGSFFFGSSFGSQQTAARTGLGATYLSANIVIYRESIQYFAPAASTNPLLHTWTLSVEEQVYLVFPTLLLGAWIVGRKLRRGSVRSAAIMLGLVGAASFALCLAASYGRIDTPAITSPTQFAFYSSLSRIWEFAIGAALVLATPRLMRVPAKVSSALGFAGAAAIAVGAFALSGSTPYPGVAVLLPVAGAAAILTAGLRPASTVPRLLATRPMAATGDLSYSWYLWHWPLIVFGAMVWPMSAWIPVALAAFSLVPAWASTRFLENPIRHNKRIVGWRAVALATVCTIIPTAACLGLAAGADASWGNEAVAQMQTQVRDRHVAASHHCDDAASSIGVAACEFNRHSDGPRIYLVGNSVAAQYSEALIGAAGAVGSPLTIDTSLGCFFGAQADVGDRECSDNFNATVDTLIQQGPGVVVMSSTWDLAGLGRDTATVNEERDLMAASLTDAVTRLREAGHQVVIVLPTPRFFNGSTPRTYLAMPDASLSREAAHETSWRPTDCWNVVAMQNAQDCGATVPEAQVANAQAVTAAWLKELAAETGSMIVDLRARFCSEGVCSTNVGDFWLFRDGIHITSVESEALAPTFAGVLTMSRYVAAGDRPTWLATSCTLQNAVAGVARSFRRYPYMVVPAAVSASKVTPVFVQKLGAGVCPITG